MLYLKLFLVYCEIGLFGFGGGYAMLSLIQDKVVNQYHWLSAQEFVDIVAVSQMTPGPIGINSATYIGYKVTGSVWGAVVATTAVSLPSFILVLIISYYFSKFRNNKYVEASFRGIRPATVGLIASAALLLSIQSGFILELISPASEQLCLDNIIVRENFVDWRSLFLFALAFVATIKKWIHPILMIVLAGLVGFALY
ncbi:chromate transporter [Porphyromonas crevioricanis]|uniref:chromate transporter n=1 Tax=Porphyromonas crevioricanis TaxID=393921 RepID=UPI00052CB8E9|nr:chromate transporter [Porphyromonas crevioricanis]KGN90997.1 chromate transporter [Porphyromonas crevioricanis]